MNTFDPTLSGQFDLLLAAREAELCAVLRALDAAFDAGAAAQGDVSDFKDAAGEEERNAVDAAQAEHAALELEQVLAARRRLQDHSYGRCMDCEEPIDLRRLTAMPAAAYCTDCQAQHESIPASPLTH